MNRTTKDVNPMPTLRVVLSYLAILLVCIVVSCLISAMALFMGGGQSGPDLIALMNIQIGSVPVAIVSAVIAVVVCGRYSEEPMTASRLYAAVPHWLVFCCVILISLAGLGEIAIVVVLMTTDLAIEWTAHAPFVAMIACSLAVCVLYACVGILSGRQVALSGRW